MNDFKDVIDKIFKMALEPSAHLQSSEALRESYVEHYFKKFHHL